MTAPVAIVTGGARRIGRGIVTRLHSDGFSVCVHYHSSSCEAEAVAAELNRQRPGSVKTIGKDLANTVDSTGETLERRCAAVIDFCYANFSRCDVLVNNASAYYPTPLLPATGEAASTNDGTSHTDDDVSNLFGSNAIAPFLLLRHFARRATAHSAREGQQRGDAGPGEEALPCVVNLGDAMLQQPLLGFSVYTMAKYALEGLTKAAAVELAAAGIRVNSVAPGLSVLPPAMSAEDEAACRGKVPLRQREASADEIAAAVSFLVSKQASYITGATINVDGGWRLARK